MVHASTDWKICRILKEKAKISSIFSWKIEVKSNLLKSCLLSFYADVVFV